MATGRIVVDLGPDEQALLSAESRRRGVGADAVIADLVRTLPAFRLLVSVRRRSG